MLGESLLHQVDNEQVRDSGGTDCVALEGKKDVLPLWEA